MSMQAVTPDGAIRRYGMNGEEYYQMAVNGICPEWVQEDSELLAAINHSETLTPERWEEAKTAGMERFTGGRLSTRPRRR